MNKEQDMVRWIPRVLGVAMVLFLGMFASDAFQGDASIGDKVLDFLMHVIPAGLCLAVVMVAWKREAIGAVVFALLAGVYTLWAMPRWDWIAVIGGALLLVAFSYAMAWWVIRSRALRSGTT